MKKFFVLGALAIASLAYTQHYPYGYQREYSYNQYDDSDWGYYDDGFYDYAYNNFPDTYYYEYPTDYYPTAYYESYYNDYRQSILGINWDRLFMEFNLSPLQIRQIRILNGRFNDFSVWHSYYGMNPDRWYYDRFYALERILGSRIYVVFQNRYYGGYSPIRHFQRYRRTHYVRRYMPMPQYRSVNVNVYNLGRDRYFQHYGNGYVRNNVSNPFRSEGFKNSENSGFRNSNGGFNGNSGLRNGTRTENNAWSNASGMRNGRTTTPQNSGFGNRTYQNRDNASPSNGGGFRNGNTSGGFRNSGTGSSGNSGGFRNSSPVQGQSSGAGQSSGGFSNQGQRGSSNGGFR